MKLNLVIAAGLLAGGLASAATTALGECTETTCKIHNRWCLTVNDWGIRSIDTSLNFDYGTIKWAESPDGGTPIQLDLVQYRIYETCQEDCDDFVLNTGSPVGNIVHTDSSNFKTECAILEDN